MALGQPLVVVGITSFCAWLIHNKYQKDMRAMEKRQEELLIQHASSIEILRQDWHDNVRGVTEEKDAQIASIVNSWQRKYEEAIHELKEGEQYLAKANQAINNEKVRSEENIRVLKSDHTRLINIWIEKCREATKRYDELFKEAAETSRQLAAARRTIDEKIANYQQLSEEYQKLHVDFTAEECHTIELKQEIDVLKTDISNLESLYSQLKVENKDLQECWQKMYEVSAKHARELVIQQNRVFQIRGLLDSVLLLTKDLDNVCNYEDTGDQGVSDAVRSEGFGGTLYT
jgi:chromosome segregation ATPase